MFDKNKTTLIDVLCSFKLLFVIKFNYIQSAILHKPIFKHKEAITDNRIYLVPVDRKFKPTQEQHEKAVEFWQKICPTYDAIISEKEDNIGYTINLNEKGYVEANYGLVAYEPHILYEYLDLPESYFESEEYAEYLEQKEEEGEDFEFEDPTTRGDNLNTETLAKFEKILGTPVEVIWEILD